MEIIGNSKNVARLQKHFKKMFAGVATIVLNDDSSQVLGLLSKEGEEVRMLHILHYYVPLLLHGFGHNTFICCLCFNIYFLYY